MKKCAKCKTEKELNEFQSEKRKPDGRSARCKICLNEDKKEYLDTKRDKIREYNRKKYYEDHERQKSLRTKRSKNLRETNNEWIANYRKYWWDKNAERLREKAREDAKKPKRRKRTRDYQKEYRKTDNYKFKKRSRSAFERAVKYGFIKRPSQCERCLKECKPDGHHEDYNKPLEVQWLCKICHFQAHGKLKDI